MTIETSITTQPVKSESTTRLTLESPRRTYAVQTKMEDGKLKTFSQILSRVREGYGTNSDRELLEIETRDLRAIAEMLIAHADELGVE